MVPFREQAVTGLAYHCLGSFNRPYSGMTIIDTPSHLVYPLLITSAISQAAASVTVQLGKLFF